MGGNRWGNPSGGSPRRRGREQGTGMEEPFQARGQGASPGIRYYSVPLLVKLDNRCQNGENVHMITKWPKSAHRELDFEDSSFEHIVGKLDSGSVQKCC